LLDRRRSGSRADHEAERNRNEANQDLVPSVSCIFQD
jgi:hypothetical protein